MIDKQKSYVRLRQHNALYGADGSAEVRLQSNCETGGKESNVGALARAERLPDFWHDAR